MPDSVSKLLVIGGLAAGYILASRLSRLFGPAPSPWKAGAWHGAFWAIASFSLGALSLGYGKSLILAAAGAAAGFRRGYRGGRRRDFLLGDEEWARAVLLGALAAGLLACFIVQPFFMSSNSMKSTLSAGDYFLADKLGRLEEIRSGDVVLFHFPPGDAAAPRCGGDSVAGLFFVKRVVGLPGDRIKTNEKTAIVPAGRYFVMGDNRGDSCDSRDWGPIAAGAIVGKPWLVYWPPSRAGRIR